MRPVIPHTIHIVGLDMWSYGDAASVREILQLRTRSIIHIYAGHQYAVTMREVGILMWKLNHGSLWEMRSVRRSQYRAGYRLLARGACATPCMRLHQSIIQLPDLTFADTLLLRAICNAHFR